MALLGFRLTARQLVATSTASAVIVDVARLPVYLVRQGQVLGSQVVLLAIMSAAVVLGTVAGVPLLVRLSEAVYRRVVGALLVLLGLRLVWAA